MLKSKYDIQLASASPRRRELLAMLGLDFTIAPTRNVDESYDHNIPANKVAQYLSAKKADVYRADMRSNQLIITADTVVINNNIILGKPSDRQEAIAMLQSLSGHTHTVVTGVTITTANRQTSFSVEAEVTFATLTEDEIIHYVDNYRPMDKAGAYGIQEWIGCIGVKNINGSFYNVMGLPLHRLYTELKTFIS